MDIINNSISFDTIGGGLSALSRQFLTFGGVNEAAGAGSYTAVDGDVIEFDFATSSALGQYFFDESTGLNRLFCLKAAAATALTVPSGVTVDINGGGNSFTVDGKLHHAKLTIGPAAAGLVIDTYFKRFNDVEFFNGVVANIQFTGSANRFYPMSGGRSGSGAYELDQLATLGADVWAGLTVNSPWVDNGGNNYTIDGSQVGNTSVTTSPGQSTGTPMLFSVTVNSKSGVGSLFLGASGNLIDVSTVQAYDVLIVSGGDLASVDVIAEAGVTADITVTSVRAAPNAMTLNNIVSTDWEKFTQVGADWLGGELVVNGGFDTDTDWTKTGGAVIAGGLGLVDGTAGNSLLFQDLLTTGRSYSTKLTVPTNDNNANNQLWDNSGNNLLTIVGTGVKSLIWTHTDASGNFLFRANTGSYEVDNVSVKRILKAP